MTTYATAKALVNQYVLPPTVSHKKSEKSNPDPLNRFFGAYSTIANRVDGTIIL